MIRDRKAYDEVWGHDYQRLPAFEKDGDYRLRLQFNLPYKLFGSRFVESNEITFRLEETATTQTEEYLDIMDSGNFHDPTASPTEQQAIQSLLKASSQNDPVAKRRLALKFCTGLKRYDRWRIEGKDCIYPWSIIDRRLLVDAVEKGDAVARFVYAHLELVGPVYYIDDKFSQFRKAAEQGYPPAQLALGLMCRHGRGTPKNDLEALVWFSLAAAKGIKEAEILRAKTFDLLTPSQRTEVTQRSTALAKDFQPALAVFPPSDPDESCFCSEAFEFHALLEAMHQLKTRYLTKALAQPVIDEYHAGQELSKEYPESDLWIWSEQSAQEGNPTAQFILGLMEGAGGKSETAYAWFDLAARQRLKEAATGREELARFMSSGKIASAKFRAASFVPSSKTPKPKPVDYSGFSSLPDQDKSQIVWNLDDQHQWGKPEHKPICRELLRTQGAFAGANAIGFTSNAIRLVKDKKWKDLLPLVAAIYEHPRNLWLYQDAFECLHELAGKPVPKDFSEALEIVIRASRSPSEVKEDVLHVARERVMNEPDKEVVMVYAFPIAGWHGGKGGGDEGRKTAAEILKTLDRQMVERRLRGFLKDFDEMCRDEMKWVADYLKIPIE